jgi:hypothetical protein
VLRLRHAQLKTGSWQLVWRQMADTLQLCTLELRGRFASPCEEWTACPFECDSTRSSFPSLSDHHQPSPQGLSRKLQCGSALRQLESSILSGGRGLFPIVPFYTPRCPDHHCPPGRIFCAYRRENAVRDISEDKRNFTCNNSAMERERDANTCDDECRYPVDAENSIDNEAYRKHYISWFARFLHAIQR